MEECLYLNTLLLQIPDLEIFSEKTIRSTDQDVYETLFTKVFDIVFKGKTLHETQIVSKLSHICMMKYFIAKNIK